MEFQYTILVLLVASNLRVWMDHVMVMAEQTPQTTSDTAAQTAGDRDGPKLPGLPVRTSKGEKDMKDPKMVYGHDENLSQYAPITVRPANYSAHFAKESGQCKRLIFQVFSTNKHIFLRCIGDFRAAEASGVILFKRYHTRRIK